jgi:hypothetical protein
VEAVVVVVHRSLDAVGLSHVAEIAQDMGPDSIHREILLPRPAEEPPAVPPIVWNTGSPFWLEIHRNPLGHVRYLIGSTVPLDLALMTTYLENTRPRLTTGHSVPCPALMPAERGILARAVPSQKHHYFPVHAGNETDPAGFLLRALGSPTLQGHDLVLQLIFRRVGAWEAGFFSSLYENVAEPQTEPRRAEMDARYASAAYHVEIRTRIVGPRPVAALTALDAWLEQWTVPGGTPWRSWEAIPAKLEGKFHAALVTHDLHQFSSKKARRDVSSSELSLLLSIPWASQHPECSYSGAPVGRPGPDLFLRPSAPSGPWKPVVKGFRLPPSVSVRPTEARTLDRGAVRLVGPHSESRLVIGVTGSHFVGLPSNWNHLAILGRTQSGKSTLALNLVLQLVTNFPAATVVVIEPTGTLIDGIVSRLPFHAASDAVEVDPAHAAFKEGDTTKVAVPLSLLQTARPEDDDPFGQERASEALAGDLLAAIRSAWGAESIGGRAELVLRALVQGLSLTPGSNLVDAYHILSSKPALQRFVKTAPPGPLRDFLERHLPRLDYDFTMSSLDKVGKIATNPLLRISLCQRSHPVSFERLLRHRLLLLNLSKAAIGAEGANFLGAVYLTQLWASLQRNGRPDRPVYLVLDEAHNYAVPALADMLSEGSKFGLHVVVLTQYLHRVPETVRASLLGNVDAWLLFSLGVEDMDDAWKIVSGGSHGWVPQDLVDGLRPHEVAMSIPGALVKLRTLPSTPAGHLADDLRETVRQSSRRYAQPEDSEASPWLVTQEAVEGLLRALSERPRSRLELADGAFVAMDQLEGALTWSRASGDVESGPSDGSFELTSRGNVHLRVLQERGNSGEEHVETLTDFAMFLRERGIAMTVPRQVPGVLLPDGQFQWGDATYNVEVECSTLVKAIGQVVRNVKKAQTAGFRVLIVLPERSRVPRILWLLAESFPGLHLWTDGVGLVWKDGPSSFRPHASPGTKVWPFLDSGPASWVPQDDEGIENPLPVPADTDPLLGQVRTAVRTLMASGKTEASLDELLAGLPASERPKPTEQQLGIALRTLGLPHRRVRVGDARVRFYSLRTPGPDRVGADTRLERGPTRWTDPGMELSANEVGHQRRAPDSSIEDDSADPTDPTGPTD